MDEKFIQWADNNKGKAQSLAALLTVLLLLLVALL